MLPAQTSLGRIHLRIGDMARSLAFYRDLLGLVELDGASGSVVLGPAGGPALIGLTEVPGTHARPRGIVGLYHFALLYPNRRELGSILLHLFEQRWPFEGFADHAVSEAAYLADPDGNGIELYADRAREDWPVQNGEVAMTTLALNVNSLIRSADTEEWNGAPAGLVVGHIHLHSAVLRDSLRFYRDVVGFDVTNQSFPGAAFLSAGGYHHHLGLNTWLRRGEPSDADAAGLIEYTIDVHDSAARDALLQRVRDTGGAVEDNAFTDPDGNRVVVV